MTSAADDTSFRLDDATMARTIVNLTESSLALRSTADRVVSIAPSAFGELMAPSVALVQPTVDGAQTSYAHGLSEITSQIADHLGDTLRAYRRAEEINHTASQQIEGQL